MIFLMGAALLLVLVSPLAFAWFVSHRECHFSASPILVNSVGCLVLFNSPDMPGCTPPHSG